MSEVNSGIFGIAQGLDLCPVGEGGTFAAAQQAQARSGDRVFVFFNVWDRHAERRLSTSLTFDSDLAPCVLGNPARDRWFQSQVELALYSMGRFSGHKF